LYEVSSLSSTFLETPMTKPLFENEPFHDEVLSKIKVQAIAEWEKGRRTGRRLTRT
jgi:hypothetical protein